MVKELYQINNHCSRYYNYDSETGLSRIDIPSWVIYSMPSADQDYGYTQGAGIGSGQTWTGYGDPSFQEYGLIVMTMDRITEYTFEVEIDTVSGDATLNGDVTFAYSTGDMGFFTFDNPLEETDPCKDCFDNDGDGWTDDLDPDCEVYGEELFETTASTCNDGIDNDGNGLTDASDPTCTTSSGESIQCSDNVDNDEDGWKDQEDPDCSTVSLKAMKPSVKVLATMELTTTKMAGLTVPISLYNCNRFRR